MKKDFKETKLLDRGNTIRSTYFSSVSNYCYKHPTVYDKILAILTIKLDYL